MPERVIRNIRSIPLVATPESMEALESYAENYSGGEQAAFVMGMCMAWNLAASITEQNKRVLEEEAAENAGAEAF